MIGSVHDSFYAFLLKSNWNAISLRLTKLTRPGHAGWEWYVLFKDPLSSDEQKRASTLHFAFIIQKRYYILWKTKIDRNCDRKTKIVSPVWSYSAG